jgi:hypothetical protein
MSDNSERPALPNYEALAKISALVLGFVYICGFLVVSIYLAGYGVHSIALLRPQYLAAGFLSVTPIWLTYVIIALFFTSFEGFPHGPLPPSGRPRIKRIWNLSWQVIWALLKIYVVASALVDVLAVTFVPSARYVLLSHWRQFSFITLQAMVFTLFLTRIVRAARHFSVHELQQDIKKTLPVILLSAFCVFSFLGYISYFAQRLYPEIPLAIGGGKPESVAFLLKQHTEGMGAPVIPDKSGTRSIPYRLVLETDASYTVLSEATHERAVQFNRDAVLGYVILEEH